MTPRTIAHHEYKKQSETCLISTEMQLRLQEFPTLVFEAFVLLFVVFAKVTRRGTGVCASELMLHH